MTNNGNTCYFNSVLQVRRVCRTLQKHTPRLHNAGKRKDSLVFALFPRALLMRMPSPSPSCPSIQ
jgi:hypothetical protein